MLSIGTIPLSGFVSDIFSPKLRQRLLRDDVMMWYGTGVDISDGGPQFGAQRQDIAYKLWASHQRVCVCFVCLISIRAAGQIETLTYAWITPRRITNTVVVVREFITIKRVRNRHTSRPVSTVDSTHSLRQIHCESLSLSVCLSVWVCDGV